MPANADAQISTVALIRTYATTGLTAGTDVDGDFMPDVYFTARRGASTAQLPGAPRPGTMEKMRTSAAIAALVLGATLLEGPAHAADALPVTNPDAGLCIVPLQPYPEKMLPAVVRGVTYVYGFRVEVLEPRPLPKVAWYPPRRRWRADRLLDWMHAEVVDDHDECRWFVGFTGSDVSTSKPPHDDWGVLGLGELGGETAVVSSFRTHKKLKPPHTATRRTVKVVNHEIGHMMGLPHQKGDGCLMNDAEGTVLTTDQETGLLCGPTIDFIEDQRGLTIPRHAEFQWQLVE